MSIVQVQLANGLPRARSQGQQNLLGERLGELPVSEWLPRLYAMGWSGAIFSAANQAAQAVSVALAAAYTGIGIYNPPNSGVNLVPLKVKFALSLAPAAIAPIGLIASWGSAGAASGLTKLTTQSGIIGNQAAGAGIPVSGAALAPNPTWVEMLEDGFTAAALPGPRGPYYMDGHLCVAPGGFLGVGALTAVTGLGSIFWAELPI